ncbi:MULTISPECIES: PAS domain-containing protein [unclassified Bradyrhizobium]|uniref:PAS domain-containing sensor histidine kinase n=1 Tax=unclassified Bradyrhizobium TaxID=2631580 RepID=UPI001FFA1364|nr:MULTISPECIES: PAS domain-containing protein [unclassified Bradyrhizobium]
MFPLTEQPTLKVIYDTAPIGLAFLSPDCRYLQINQRLTDICGISVEGHLGNTVRDCVPALADSVESIVASIVKTGEPVLGIEVAGQRADQTEARFWVTYWHPVRGSAGEVVGVNVAAEEITDRKRAEAALATQDAALRESESRFRELADNISQFAWTADAAGSIYWYNKRWHDYAGTTLEDMQGWGWRKVHHPDHVDRVVERIQQSFDTGTPWEDTFPLRSRDGSYRWFLSRALPIRNEAGEVVRWFGTNTDVTEQMAAENALRISVERQTATADILSVIASSPSDIHPVLDAIAERSNRLVGGHTTTVVRVVGDVVDLAAFTSLGPEADAALRAWFPQSVATSPLLDLVREGQTEISDTDSELADRAGVRDIGRARGFRSLLLTPMRNEKGLVGLISVTRKEPGPFARHHVDLLRTFADQAVIAMENVRLFEELQARTRDLSISLEDLRAAQGRLIQTEKLASLGQLTAGIAHEIKNPLNFVTNFSALSTELIDDLDDTLGQAALDGTTRKEVDELTLMLKGNLERVVQHCARADSIVKNMLLHSREGAGELRPADINAIVEESLALAYHGARAERPGYNVTLECDLDPDAGMIDIYPQEITRVFLNVISNGFYAAAKRKESAGNGFEPVLSAATKSFSDRVEVTIHDNGAGIPPEVKDKMFNPFFTTKPAGEGTGLGLSLSHDIVVKQHGGRIDVVTEPGAFTEFIVTLPRTAARAKAGGTE